MLNEKYQALDITIEDKITSISRNYGEPLIIKHKGKKELIALLDALINPEKYDIHIQELREQDGDSKMTNCISVHETMCG